jgi:hypothetical protein
MAKQQDEPTNPPNAVDRPNRQLDSIPFGAIIGGPLKAAIEGQAMAAKSTIDFIEEVAFEKKGDVNEVVYVEFKYSRNLSGGGSGSDNNMTLKVPLITLVPIPFIRIDELNVAFKANIFMEEASEISKGKAKEGSLGGKVGGLLSLFNIGFSGGFSSKKDSSESSKSKYSVEYTLDINMHATQEDMPTGMQKMLNILTRGLDDTAN